MNSLIDNRQIRVFISSTFQDMQAERDYLMTSVFPRLRRKAAERDVSLVELDLRWGITEEEAQNGKVVQICLNEIDNSHPFFIGLLGDRYGWCPPIDILQQDTSLAERYPWIKEDLNKGKSVTEIEMLYGVLRRVENDLNACFFIKTDGPNIESKQLIFKEKIRANGSHPYKEYTTPEDLGNKVESVFLELLDRLFPQKELSELELERLSQRTFLHGLSQVYIRNEDNFKVLDDFLKDRQRYLVIAGESGMGKSALIANWLKDHREEKTYNIIYHFVGNSGAEGDYTRILSRVIDEIYDLYDIPKPDQSQSDFEQKEPKEVLQELILKACSVKPLLIVLDGINQLSDHDDSRSKYLNWLPSLPEGSKMLFSTIENDETMETFRRREYPVFSLKPLDNDQRCEMIVNYLSRYGKALTSAQVMRISEDSKSQNTLVLRTLLDELICFGVYEQLDVRINHYLTAENIEDFFQRVLLRAEEDYGLDVVRDTLSLIAVSYDGMSETEVLEITQLPPLRWSAFYCSFASHFTVRNGLIIFSHSYFRNAVAKRYLDTLSETNYRQCIIEYFKGDEDYTFTNDNSRRWSELVHQYYNTRRNNDLHAMVLKYEVFHYFFEKRIDYLVSIWRQLLLDISEKYSLYDYISENNKSYFGFWDYLDLATFVKNDFHEYKLAYKVYDKAIKALYQLSSIKDDIFEPGLSRILEGMGSVHLNLKNYESAEMEYKEALAIRRKLMSKDSMNEIHIPRILSSLGIVHNSLNNYSLAEKEFLEALSICQRLSEKNPDKYEWQLAYTLYHLGSLHRTLKEYTKAEKEYREALEIRRGLVEIDPKNEVSVADTLYCLGCIHEDLKNYEVAEKEYAESVDIYHRLSIKYSNEYYDLSEAQVCLTMAFLYIDLNDCKKSEMKFYKAFEIYRRLSFKNPKELQFKSTKEFVSEMGMILHDMGNLYYIFKDYGSAKEKYIESLEIFKNLESENPGAYESKIKSLVDEISKLDRI